MNALSLSAGIIALTINVLLCVQVLSGKVKQNFATWALWGVIDAIVAATIICQDGNFLLPAAYALGSLAVAVAILKSKEFKWTWFETMMTCFAAICLAIWSVSGAKVATVASTLAIVFAGTPQALAAYKKPWDQPFWAYVGFLVAAALSTAGGRDWSIEERFYPATCAVLTFVVVVFIARKFWLKRVL